MNKVLFKYLLSGYFITVFKVTLIAYCFGIIFNLFEEIEFFKNLDVTIFKPLIFTSLFIPSMIIKLMPFIIFVSGMWFLFNLRNSSDLLTLKVYGYSNFKIFFILAFSSFVFGWIILFAFNPITSSMMKIYEQNKANYARDIDHLVSMNKNGLWIKENLSDGYRIITSDETTDKTLKNLIIFSFSKDGELKRKIYSKSTDISDNKWSLSDVIMHNVENGLVTEIKKKNLEIFSSYDHKKINSLFKNFDTMSFLDLALNYKDLQKKGYNKAYLDQSLNSMLSMPFFLFIMISLSSILTMNTLKRSNNLSFIVVGLITCIIVYYFKDLSLALGQTNRIPLSLSAWIPIITIGLFSSVGVLQINEKYSLLYTFYFFIFSEFIIIGKFKYPV